MTLTLTRTHILFFFSLFWFSFLSLQGSELRSSAIFTMISLAALFVVPGTLTLFIARLDAPRGFVRIALMLGISILEIMLVPLIGNALLPHLGIERPLDPSIILSQLSIFVAALIALAWVRTDSYTFTLKRYIISDSGFSALVALCPIFFVLMSASGAALLNNGGSTIMTLIMLVFVAFYLLFLLFERARIDENILPIALFFISLALLSMTSLRGEFITGHDIQREFQVFQITKQSGLWSIGFLKDAYNACLSITILPTIISAFSNITDTLVYKVVFQIIFAFVPGILYLYMRTYVQSAIAFIASLYFIVFPTFFSDMPFLNRQEIAFFFLALMFLILNEERLSLLARRILFLTLGIGMVISHYSTTYTVIALLMFVVCARPFALLVAKMLQRPLFQESGIGALRGERSRARITLLMVLTLGAASFLWSSVLTDTSNNSLYRVIGETAAVILQPGKDDARSSDVMYGLFSRTTIDPAVELRNYDESFVQGLRTTDAPGTYFSDTVLAQYPIAPAQASLMPLTPVGQSLRDIGFNVHGFNAVMRQSSAKMLQIFIVIGLIALMFSARYLKRPLDTEFVLLCFGSCIMLVAIIVLPVLSSEYGLLRAFQQSLMFLSLSIVIGTLTLVYRVHEKIAISCAGALAVVFLLSSTGVITQLLGGYEAQLHLNNAGTYYDTYTMHRGDIVGTEWLLKEMQAKGVYGYQSGLAVDVFPFISRSLTDVEVFKNIYPGLVRTKSYLLVPNEAFKLHRANVIYHSDVLTYEYPIDFLDNNKNLIYSNGSVAVYR